MDSPKFHPGRPCPTRIHGRATPEMALRPYCFTALRPYGLTALRLFLGWVSGEDGEDEEGGKEGDGGEGGEDMEGQEGGESEEGRKVGRKHINQKSTLEYI
jgi:hypothetical protein